MYKSSLRIPLYGKKIKQQQSRLIITKNNNNKTNTGDNQNIYKKQHNIKINNKSSYYYNNIKQTNSQIMNKPSYLNDQKRILQQISSNKNIINKNKQQQLQLIPSNNNKTNPHHYNYNKQVKTQNSVNDLSDIIYLDSSLKKNQQDLDIQIIDVYINNNQKEQEKNIYNNRNYNTNINNNDKNEQYDDQYQFQILGISNYKKQQSYNNSKQQYYHQYHKLQHKIQNNIQQNYNKNRISQHRPSAGLIRCNSKLIQKKQQQTNIQKQQLSNNKNKHNYQNQHQHNYEHQNQQIKQKLRSCAHLLFKYISPANNSIKQCDIRKSCIDRDIKLILGPIISKFNLKKYKELNQEQFIKEFIILFDDFNINQTQEMVEKILKKKREYQYKNKEMKKQKQKQINHNQHFNNYQQDKLGKNSNIIINNDKDKNEIINDTRLKNLHSKVDSFLNRINKPSSISVSNINQKNNKYRNHNLTTPSQYSKYSNPSSSFSSSSFQHQLQSNIRHSLNSKQLLMSQLSQIQQISHDSENIIQISLQQNNEQINQQECNNSIKLNHYQSYQQQNSNGSMNSFNRIGLQFNQLEKYIND